MLDGSFERQLRGRWMNGQLCHPPLSHPTDASIDYLWRDWLSLAELSAVSVCPACCLSFYTPEGRAMTHTHTHHTLCISSVVHTHTSTYAQILLTSSMQQKKIRHPCIHAEVCSFASHIRSGCVPRDTHVVTAAQPSLPKQSKTKTL